MPHGSAGAPPSYRWVVLGVSTGVNALAWGTRATFALFYVALLEHFQWGRGATALGYSLSWLSFVVFAPVAGWLSDRWGARAIVLIGGGLLGLALALTAQVTSLTGYYACFGGIGGAGLAGMLVPSTTIVTQWFLRSRGTAMGVLSTGGPASAVVFYPLIASLITTLGWRAALVSFGALIAAVTASLAMFYRMPARVADAAIGPARPVEFPTRQQWTLVRALRSTRLWAAFTMTALGVIGFQIMATHQVAHAVDRGFEYTRVVWLFSLGAACMMAGNLLGGWLSDRFGRGSIFALGTVVAIAGIGCFILLRGPQDDHLLYLYVVSAVGFGMRIAQLSTIPADVFAGPQLGVILGVVHAGGGLGGAIGPFLGGWLFDITGSYGAAFVAASLAVAGSAVAASHAAQPRRDRAPGARHGSTL
ncbi:MAG TPA: MFS transporter [Methylomirabilota bacterium]|jgi:MFS family permease